MDAGTFDYPGLRTSQVTPMLFAEAEGRGERARTKTVLCKCGESERADDVSVSARAHSSS